MDAVIANRTFLFEKKGAIFLFCAIYALHMVEEFSFGFVEWGNVYFGEFDWTQNLIGNAAFFALLSFACYLYDKNPTKHLWLGMAAAMWVLSNAFLHVSMTILGKEYSPGVVTAVILYIPSGLYFLAMWSRKGVLTWKNLVLSFVVGGMVFMLVPTFVRAILLHAKLAQLFHLVR